VALTNSGGEIQEAYDTDAYGNTIIFTGPGPDNTWFTDDDTQSSYGASDIIYCGYRYDAETGNYYVRNRYYSPTLGRWLTRDPIGYQGGINLYGFVNSSPVGNVDAAGLWYTDQWFGFNNPVFRGWVHREMKDKGDEDIPDKEQMEALFELWEKLGRPNSEGHKTDIPKGGGGGPKCQKKPWSGKRGGKRGFDGKKSRSTSGGLGQFTGIVVGFAAIYAYDQSGIPRGLQHIGESAQTVGRGVGQLAHSIAAIPGEIGAAVGDAWTAVGNWFTGPSEPVVSPVDEPVGPDEVVIPAE
jgi:RHS repeat-associated protein